METIIRETFLLIKLTDMEYINIIKEQLIKVIGKKIYSMEKVNKFGLMVQLLMDNFTMVKSMVSGNLFGLAKESIRDILKEIAFREMVYINGMMVENIKERFIYYY